MANTHVVNAETPEAVDKLAAHDVLDDRPLACPFDGGKVLGFRDGFAVVEKTAIKVVVEILQRVGNDAILVFGIEFLSAADRFKIVRSLATNLVPFADLTRVTRSLRRGRCHNRSRVWRLGCLWSFLVHIITFLCEGKFTIPHVAFGSQ